MNKHLYRMIITGLGTALFFVIGRFLAIPTPIPNFSLYLQYAILVVFGFYFGPVVGFGVGFLGHLLIDLLSGYGIWITWIISSGVFGLLVGLVGYIINKWPNPYKPLKIVIFSLATAVAGAICWIVIAPLGDILVYQVGLETVFVEGLVAFSTNVASALIMGLPLIFALKRVPIKHIIINKGEQKHEKSVSDQER